MRRAWRWALVVVAVLGATPCVAAVWVDEATRPVETALVPLPSPLPPLTIEEAYIAPPYRAVQAIVLIAVALVVAQRMRPRGAARP